MDALRPRTPRLTEITSAKNDLYKQWLSLLTSKGIKDHGEFLISGENICLEFLSHHQGYEILGELIPFDFASNSFASDVRYKTIDSLKKYHVDKNLFKELDVINTKAPILWVKTREIAPWNAEESFSGVRLILPLGDPTNLGAVLRSAEAFGVREVVLCSESANPYLPKSVKSSSGSSLRIKYFKGPNLKDVLSANIKSDVYLVEQGGENLKTTQWPSSFYLLSGEERGLGNLEIPVKFKKVSISTQGVESLNVTVALSVALYEICR